jgi:sulfatase maturation enzyme AslB (radical SAM superfamily)
MLDFKNKSKTFCMHPFTGLATREDGAIQVCCRSHPIGWIQNNSLEEIWNNENMLQIRKQVLNNERPIECSPCFNLEDQGVESLRQRHITSKIPESRIKLYPNALDDLREDFSMPFKIPTMEIKLNNLCNLKCRMCHPMDSTSWNDWEQIEEFYIKDKNFTVDSIRSLGLLKKPYLDKFDDNPNWWNSFEKVIPYFRRVEFAGGEPLMDPQHYQILDMLKTHSHQIEIKYATNLTVLGIKGNRTVWDYWPRFQSVAVNVSLDGIGDVYEHIRGNSNWKNVVDNIKQIQTIPNISRIVGAVAVQIGNILTLDKIIETFLNDLGIVFYTNIVNYPKALCPQVLPIELKDLAICRLENIKPKIKNFKLVKENPMLLDITHRQIQGVINFINAKDQSNLWKDCIEFNRRLDKSRNQMPFELINPEFKAYV